jgi:hypothetical protein
MMRAVPVQTSENNARQPRCTIFQKAFLRGENVLCRRWILTAAPLTALCLWQTCAFAQQTPLPDHSNQTSPNPDKPDEIEILNSPPEPSTVPSTPPPAEIKTPNFTSCSMAELQKVIPELGHLKAAQDQSQLPALLDKIGAKTVDIARRTPNLVSDESVISDHLGIMTVQNFSFLVLQHISKSGAIILDEFRVDARSGEKFQTEELENAVEASARSSESSSLGLPSGRSLPGSEKIPPAQGFVSEWLNFYPPNRLHADFRYLGQQKLKGRPMLVVAFAQKPAFIPLPAIFAYENRLYKIFLQGVAWVDANDFRIVRMRTDILSSPPGVPLRQFSADTQFTAVRVADIAMPLWLPRQVVITSNLAASTLRETHSYSHYPYFERNQSYC